MLVKLYSKFVILFLKQHIETINVFQFQITAVSNKLILGFHTIHLFGKYSTIEDTIKSIETLTHTLIDTQTPFFTFNIAI